MVKPRVIETNQGIQGEFDVKIYDSMMRRMRDKGWIETNLILKAGIMQGSVLEVGPGPGYLGLEWLKKTEGTNLRALEISSEMITIAEKNALEYGFESRVEYIEGNAQEMPFENNMFDGVFSNGSLHEWAEPEKVFNEINRFFSPEGDIASAIYVVT
jgi:ubiquinone/menaquinone biosynthesis C-methylase UbiE